MIKKQNEINIKYYGYYTMKIGGILHYRLINETMRIVDAVKSEK